MRDDVILPFHPPLPEPELLDRYLAGECSEAEVARVRAWAGTSPTGMSYADGLREAYQAIHTMPVNVEGVRRTLRQKIGGGVFSTRALPRSLWGRGLSSGKRDRLFWSTVAIVAGSCLAIIAGVRPLGWSLNGTSNDALGAAHTYTTTAGERATMTLDDRTQVTLAPQTTLTVPKGFGVQSRTVLVQGEAYFTVIHTQGLPFVIQTGSTVTRVLGTAFNVRRYASDHATRVAVVQGKVGVRTLDHHDHWTQNAVLSANMMALCPDSGGVTILPPTSVENELAWRDGRLVFQATPLRDVAVELTRAYGVTVRIGDSTLAEHRVTFSTSVTARSLSAVLDALVATVNAHYLRQNNTITLLPGEHARSPRSSTPSSSESAYGR